MFSKAERRKAKLRLAISGPAGSGKTYGSLLVAFGLGGKIALIDTENGSGNLYSSLGEYYVEPLEAPYTVEKYIAAIHEAEQAGFDVLIIDSLSHAWAGSGGLLERKEKIAETNKNVTSYTAWSKVTPLHNQLIDTILSANMHMICNLRSKIEYVLVENDRGKKEPRKVGLAPVQRDGVEYEFDAFFCLNADHTTIVSKDRTSLFDGQVLPTLSREVGERLKDWLESGIDVHALEAQKHELYGKYTELLGGSKEAQSVMLQVVNGKNWRDWTSEDLNVLTFDLNKRREALHQSAPTSSTPVAADTPPDNGIEFEDACVVLEPAVNA